MTDNDVALAQPEAPPAGPDWDVYRRLKVEGRVNLLFRLSKPLSDQVQGEAAVANTFNVLPFVSHAEHLAWRAQWKRGRWVKLNWTPEERAAILEQDQRFRQADEMWARKHGPFPGGGVLFRIWR